MTTTLPSAASDSFRSRSATATALTISWVESNIAVVRFDLPGKSTNLLSAAVMNELAGVLDEIERRPKVAGLVLISGKPGTFIAGADVREFAASLDQSAVEVTALCRRGQALFARLTKAPFVSVAAIDGVCVGGGAELAVWCDRRVLSTNAKTSFGFPEVKLGLTPGWGGTARTPRIIGLANAVEMLTSGEPVDACGAVQLELATDAVPAEDLLAAAIAVVHEEQQTKCFLSDRKQWSRPLEINATELAFLGATATAMIRQQTKGQYPAPQLVLDLMLETAKLDLATACQREAELMPQLFGTPINRALLNVFFLNDRVKRSVGVAGQNIAPKTIHKVGVVGAGIMGSGIAAAALKRELHVTMTDAADNALARGSRDVLDEVAFDKQTRLPDAARALKFAPLLNPSTELASLAQCDLVIEAVVETLDVKRQVFGRLEPLLPPHAILASNTSTIPISKMAESLARPDQFCGLHFFNPVRKMPLVEVIRGAHTNDQTIATVVAFAKRIGKLPIVVKDGPGFLVNRLLGAYMNEALALVSEGVPLADIEQAATRFGMPLGPFSLYDMVGVDTAMYAGSTLLHAFPDRTIASPVLPAMVKAKRLGQKNGLGFFNYQNKKAQPTPDSDVERILSQYIKEHREWTAEELTARLFYVMVLEATRVLQDNVVTDVRDIDFGVIFGLGFPAFRGGVLFWADSLGAARIVEELKRWRDDVGTRFDPTPLLLDLAARGGKFYDMVKDVP